MSIPVTLVPSGGLPVTLMGFGRTGTPLGIVAETIDGWTRPLDWLAMPDVTSAENKFCGLFAVFEHGRNAVALQATVSGAATYVVDFGDGTVKTVTSGVTVEHTYTYSTLAASSLSSRGYKQAVVTVTPSSGGTFTAFSLSHRATGERAVGYAVGWLDIIASLPSVTSFASFAGGIVVASRMLERIDLRHTTAAATSFESFARNASSLNVFSYAGSLANVATFAFCFSNASTIQRIVLTGVSAICTTLSNFANAAGSLREVAIAGVLSGVTTIATMLSGSLGVRRVVFPTAAWTALTTTTNAFNSTSSLQVIEGTPPAITFSLADSNMDKAQLEAMFALLPTVTSQTLTITGNPGAATAVTTVATGKGWTIVA